MEGKGGALAESGNSVEPQRKTDFERSKVLKDAKDSPITVIGIPQGSITSSVLFNYRFSPLCMSNSLQVRALLPTFA